MKSLQCKVCFQVEIVTLENYANGCTVGKIKYNFHAFIKLTSTVKRLSEHVLQTVNN